jgi:molybdopterin/thiamine biosynthesis adenylyltransferase
MPSNAGIMARHLEEGILRADSYLRRECGARRLPDADARSVDGRSYVAGWQLVLETDVARHRVNVYADHQFPFSIPRFCLVDGPPFLTWPHIEEDGLMCLPTGRVAKFREPDNVIGELLRDAYRLIDESERGANENDFRSEFYSYWNRKLSTDSEKVRSLLDPHGPSRPVRIWRGKTCPVVGENEQQVLGWLRNLYGDKPQFDSTDEACLLWIKEPLLPREYPKTAADIYRLASSVPGGKDLLAHLAKTSTHPFYFLIGADSGNGPCLAAVRTAKPVATDFRGKKRDPSKDGFRPGKVPPNVQALRLFSSDATATRMRGERADPEWIHGRGQDPRQKELRSKTVLVFGCGSVGAPIAHQLVMAGVGRIILVDPDVLSWANVGRHPLGADHVDLHKALALAEIWQKAYPHARIEGYAMTSHQFLEDHAELVGSADIILCAVADWKAELELNLRQVSAEITVPLLYVWIERNACAGHAVLIVPGGPCLQCGFLRSGDAKLQVTLWPVEKKETMEPACGAIFQPYGPVELLGTISAGAALALDGLLKKITTATHRVWAGQESLLLEAGGGWSTQWIEGKQDRTKGGFQEDRVWERDSHCDICGACEPASPSSSRLDSQRSASSSAPPS